MRKGGLRLKRIEEWNKGEILEHIWNLFAKSGYLWVAWVKVNLLKGRSFWQLKIQLNATWSWRKILMLGELAKKFLKFSVGDGSSIHLLWLDW